MIMLEIIMPSFRLFHGEAYAFDDLARGAPRSRAKGRRASNHQMATPSNSAPMNGPMQRSVMRRAMKIVGQIFVAALLSLEGDGLGHGQSLQITLSAADQLPRVWASCKLRRLPPAS